MKTFSSANRLFRSLWLVAGLFFFLALFSVLGARGDSSEESNGSFPVGGGAEQEGERQERGESRFSPDESEDYPADPEPYDYQPDPES